MTLLRFVRTQPKLHRHIRLARKAHEAGAINSRDRYYGTLSLAERLGWKFRFRSTNHGGGVVAL